MSQQHPETKGTGTSDPAVAPGATAAAVGTGGTKDRAQYGLRAGLALLGAYVLFDASRIGAVSSSNDPVGPKPMPILLGVLLLVVGAVSSGLALLGPGVALSFLAALGLVGAWVSHSLPDVSRKRS